MTKTRFAPSPTGLIHIGNARTAVMNWLFALQNGGTFLLRFDDTDVERSKAEYADAIEKDLNWLGIMPHETVKQSERFALYDKARDALIAAGRLYPCYETPDELDRRRARARAMGKPPIYDRAALALTPDDIAKLEAEGRKPHWRFKLTGDPVSFDDVIRGPQTVNTSSMSDPVLIRADGSYLYTLPSVVDDIDLGVTHIIRGEDHVSNTGVQIDLFQALGGTPPSFAHHNLLTDEKGQGLSKRLGSLALSDLHAEGYEPLAVAIMASLTGTSAAIEPLKSLEALSEKLDFSGISHGPARYDPAELTSLNAKLLHTMSFDEVAERIKPFGIESEAVWLVLRENLVLLNDIAEWHKLVAGPVTPVIEGDDAAFLAQAAELLPQEPWDETTWSAWTGALKQATERKGKSLFLPLRLALTGRHDGPELKNLLPLIGRKSCLDRLA
jgi:glutamyl-tRNA synthetase